MKKILLFILLAYTGISCSGKHEQFSGALLWKISGNGNAQPSYILGTHHMFPISFYESMPGLKKAISETAQTAGELNMLDKDEMDEKIKAAMVMPQGESYRDMLQEGDYTRLDEGLKDLLHVGLEELEEVHPAAISTMVGVAVQMKVTPDVFKEAYDPIDSYIQRIAINNGKQVLGLETVEEQIYALFDSESLEFQTESLLCHIHNIDYVIESTKKLNDFYRAGNLSGMYDISNDFFDPCAPSENSMNALNRDRNERWLEKLPDMMAEKPTLVAVGALHLAGKDGLLYQLNKMGYKVEPVKK